MLPCPPASRPARPGTAIVGRQKSGLRASPSPAPPTSSLQLKRVQTVRALTDSAC